MKKTFTVMFLAFMLLLSFGLQAQTMDYKSGYQFPVADEDSVLNGLTMPRGMDYHADPLGGGTAAFAVTNYNYNGFIHLFKNAGDDALELVWTSPAFDSLGGSSRPRFVKFGDMDNDGTIELIAPFNQNGIVIYEWDGVADSWNFGDAPARIIADPLYPTADSSTSYHSVEFLDIADLDNDGQNELMLSNNSTGTTYDRMYIFSILGTYKTGDPGFSSIKREGHWPRTGVYGNYGGGTPYGIIAANLDGDPTLKEMVFTNYNYGAVTTVRTTGEDTYELADTTGGNHFQYSTYPIDAVAMGGGTALDIDGDGRDEVYLPLAWGTGDAEGKITMVHYEVGDNLAKVDSNNIFMLDVLSVYSGIDRSLYGRPGYGDYDQDGKINLYFSARQPQYIISSEFQGGDKTDPLNWMHEVLFTGRELDEQIFASVAYIDSAGILDTIKVLQSEDESTIAMKAFSAYSDFDKDGYEDIIMPTQLWLDSIDVEHKTWKDSAYTDYDTTWVYPGTDSAYVDHIDTTDYEGLWDVVESKVVEPNRISIRMLESSVLGTSIRAKDMTIITPNDYKLHQNYPNPFNPTTNIEFYLPVKKKISLTIYNALGQRVKTLVNNEVLNRGVHLREWDSTNESGVKVASGMYIYELKYGNFAKNKRMMLLK